MNNFQMISIFITSFLSIGNSVMLYLYSDIQKDLVDTTIFVSCITSAVNMYTIYSLNKGDELGYTKDYKAVNEEDTCDKNDIWSLHDEVLKEGDSGLKVDSLYEVGLSDEEV